MLKLRHKVLGETMREFFTKHRIWYLATFLIQLICGFLIFLPHFAYKESGEVLSYSTPYFYEEIGLASIYSVTMIVYFFATAPLFIGGFLKYLKRWPAVFSLVIASLYTLLNGIWMGLVLAAGMSTTGTFAPTFWFYLYAVIQLAAIANLIFLIVKVNPDAKPLKKKKRY